MTSLFKLPISFPNLRPPRNCCSPKNESAQQPSLVCALLAVDRSWSRVSVILPSHPVLCPVLLLAHVKPTASFQHDPPPVSISLQHLAPSVLVLQVPDGKPFRRLPLVVSLLSFLPPAPYFVPSCPPCTLNPPTPSASTLFLLLPVLIQHLQFPSSVFLCPLISYSLLLSSLLCLPPPPPPPVIVARPTAPLPSYKEASKFAATPRLP